MARSQELAMEAVERKLLALCVQFNRCVRPLGIYLTHFRSIVLQGMICWEAHY